MKVIGENRIADLWDRIKNYVDPKADKIPEVNHGTSDTTFTLTPNIMHIWGEVSSLTLTFPEDTNTVLDEFMFTFTSPSTPTTLTLPATIKWIQEPNIEAGKTYLVSVVNGLAGYLTDGMEIGGGDENIIEEITVNGTTVPVVDKVATITAGTVNSVTVNGNNYTPDTNGLVNLGTISGGEGGTGGEYNVIEGVTFNGTTAPITNKIAAITYTAPTLSKGTTTGSGNAVTDISVSGHTVTLTKGTTFLTSHQDISGKANDADVVHKTGNETIAGNKTFQGQIVVDSSDNYIENSSGYLIINSDTGVQVTGNGLETFGCGIYSDGQIEAPTIKCTDTGNRASNKFFATDGTIQTLPTGSGGEANVIESVKVNGTALTVTNKAVDITAVPASIVTQDATHRFVSDTEKSTWNSKVSTDTKNTAGATATTVTGSNKFYLVGAPEQTANPTTNTINYFYVDASGLNIPTDINALNLTATLGKIILPGTGGGILADGTGNILSTTKVWNTSGSYTDISGFITSSDIPTLSKGTTSGSGNAVTDISVSGHTVTLTKGSTFATDSNVVHISGTETISGNKTFSGETTITVGPVINFIVNGEQSGESLKFVEGGNAYVDILNTKSDFGWIMANNGSLNLLSVLDAKEVTSNKVTSISSSSTNTQYPSALAVYNFGTNLVSQLTTVYSGSGAPASSLGSNGDIYIKVT